MGPLTFILPTTGWEGGNFWTDERIKIDEEERELGDS